MNFSELFIRKPVATTLLMFALALSGLAAYRVLPVSPLPRTDFPAIQVSAGLPGASPETMASSVAAPLERQLGHIAGLNEMTSSSSLGSTSIALQFDLSRDIDAAARDVQAAINAARSYLPASLPSNPTWRKSNPSDSPIMILALTSDTLDTGRLYDAASTILQQKVSQLSGVGQVTVGGSSLPAVRVELNPSALYRYGISLEEVRTFLANANVNRPKGQLADDTRTWDLSTSDQLLKAELYKSLILAYRNGAPVRLSDVANVHDSVENLRVFGMANGKPSVVLVILRQPGANIIATVDRIRAALPQLQAAIPQAMTLSVVLDRTETIRASVRDVERTLLVSVLLVIVVVFLFLRNLRVTLIPGVAVPLSLIGTFGVMYLLNYSLDNLSLMALTIATGFVVDDAIVVVENVTRYLERGLSPFTAALCGAREIGFTVVAMSLSLVAVFIPILLMGGLVGRLFREFAVTLSITILVSLTISLTLTPMMCAILLKPEGQHGRLYRASESMFTWMQHKYEASLAFMLRHSLFTLTMTVLTIGLNIYLVSIIPKGFFPEQDTGRIAGGIQADQSTSFQAMRTRLSQIVGIVQADPAVASVVAFTGGSNATNTGRLFAALKPLAERHVPATQVIARLRPELAQVPGATLYLQAAQELQIGARPGNALYQYTLQSENLDELNTWAPRVLERLRRLPQLTDVSSDQQDKGLDVTLQYDRPTAARLGISTQLLDNTLYDAFGQRQVSTMYTPLNQYHVVMEAEPRFWQDPQSLRDIYVVTSTGAQVPLRAVTHDEPTTASLAVTHQSQFPAVTISFNLAPGIALSDAVAAIDEATRQLGQPTSVHAQFAGTAQAFQASLKNEPLLIAAALVAVYIVLGMLYESYIHPLTILSTLPSAGVGAMLALMLCRTDLSLIALIGVILLIGIVKKNAILMIDFALDAERTQGKSSRDAIHEACLLRFRPILMTTLAALFGGLPLAVGAGAGSELRQPLGIAIVGGLIVSQALTLYTTPVVYLYFDRLRVWISRPRARDRGGQTRTNQTFGVINRWD
jgi:multidrug efflux pump